MSKKISIPNFTAIPNPIFDEIPNMTESEIRLILVIGRYTYGFHREVWVATFDTLMKKTGLSRQSILNGTDALIERGWLRKDTSKGVSRWQIVHAEDDSAVKPLDQDSLTSRPPSKKERIKKSNLPDDSGEQSNPHRKMVGVLAKVTGLDYRNKRFASRLALRGKEIFELGHEVSDVITHFEKGGSWYEEDWRGKQNQLPTPENVVEKISFYVTQYQSAKLSEYNRKMKEAGYDYE
jgi:hypothetical protein